MKHIIYFRKNVKEEVFINDALPPFHVGNSYFPLEEKDVSRLFYEQLETGVFSVISIGNDVEKKNKFLPFLVEDEKIKAREKVEKAEFDRKQEIEKIIVAKKEEEILLEEKLEQEKEKKVYENVNILNPKDVPDMLKNMFLTQDN